MTPQTRRLRGIGQVRAFVDGNGSVDHGHRDRKSAHAFVGDQLRRLGYKGPGKRDKGTVRRFLARTTGFSGARSAASSGTSGRSAGSRTRAIGRSNAATRRRTSGCRPRAAARVSHPARVGGHML